MGDLFDMSTPDAKVLKCYFYINTTLPPIKPRSSLRKITPFAQEARFSRQNPTISRCSCVAMRANKWGFAESLNQVANLLLSQYAFECCNEVAHGGIAVTSNHMIDCLDMVDVILPGD